MNITSNMKIDLRDNNGSAWIQTMQEDTNTRCLEIQLYSGNEPWEIPAGTTAAVGFRKPDGTAGLYDRMPDGTEAITLSANRIRLILVPQMLTAAGLVKAVVTLYDEQRNQLSTFPFYVHVEENPAVGEILSENYCYCTSIAEINDVLNTALNRMEETVSMVESKVENGEFNGKSAYAYARDAGYTGTEEDFSQALANGMVDEQTLEKIVTDYLEENPPVVEGIGGNGATFIPSLDESGNLSWRNDKGLSNPPAVNIRGPKGETGVQGPTGPQGEKGEKGDKGETGATGPQGPRGEKGADGTGVTILGSYETAEALRAAHPAGDVGESYLVAGHLFVWSQSDSDWIDVGNIQGPQGEKGEQGDPGQQGIQGVPGEKGEQGETGLQGEKGDKGDPGEQGPAGADGAQGAKGDDGADGYSPVRGTDYWTSADIAEIKSYVDNAILGGVW